MEFILILYSLILLATFYALWKKTLETNMFQFVVLKIWPFILYIFAVCFAFNPILELHEAFSWVAWMASAFILAIILPSADIAEKEKIDTFSLIIFELPITLLTFFAFNAPLTSIIAD